VNTGAAKKSANLPPTSLHALAQKLGTQQPVFIENKGQFDPRVRFQMRSGRKTLWLTDNGIVFDFVKVDPSTADSSSATGTFRSERQPSRPPTRRWKGTLSLRTSCRQTNTLSLRPREFKTGPTATFPAPIRRSGIRKCVHIPRHTTISGRELI
jgi:hypothetical protein